MPSSHRRHPSARPFVCNKERTGLALPSLPNVCKILNSAEAEKNEEADEAGKEDEE